MEYQARLTENHSAQSFRGKPCFRESTGNWANHAPASSRTNFYTVNIWSNGWIGLLPGSYYPHDTRKEAVNDYFVRLSGSAAMWADPFAYFWVELQKSVKVKNSWTLAVSSPYRYSADLTRDRAPQRDNWFILDNHVIVLILLIMTSTWCLLKQGPSQRKWYRRRTMSLTSLKDLNLTMRMITQNERWSCPCTDRLFVPSTTQPASKLTGGSRPALPIERPGCRYHHYGQKQKPSSQNKLERQGRIYVKGCHWYYHHCSWPAIDLHVCQERPVESGLHGIVKKDTRNLQLVSIWIAA